MSLSHEKVQELQRENSHLLKENQRMTTHLSYADTKLRFVNFTNHYHKNCSFKFIFYYLKIEDFFVNYKGSQDKTINDKVPNFLKTLRIFTLEIERGKGKEIPIGWKIYIRD